MSTTTSSPRSYTNILKDLSKKFPHKVGFFSDCEGHYDVWQRYLKMSLVLYIPEHSEVCHIHPSEDWRESLNSTSFATQQIRLRDNCHFIYGGDVCDRGNGDIRLLKDLLALKERYPERIHFILGNRDVNKLRLPTALHEKVLAYHPLAYWVKVNMEEMSSFPLHDRNAKMKWILKQTMGAPFSYECRRQELQELGLPYDDDAVTESYLSLILPNGLLCRYLQCGKMAMVFEDTIYVHGALNDYYLGWVPPTFNHIKTSSSSATVSSTANTSSSEVIPNPLEWTEKINRFAASEIQHYVQTIHDYLREMDRNLSNTPTPQALSEYCWDIEGGSAQTNNGPRSGSESTTNPSPTSSSAASNNSNGYGHRQPGSRLIQCGMGVMPDKSTNPSVIYNSYLENGKPIHISERVCAWLAASNIVNVIVGHQPNGDAPLMVNNDYYSSDGQWKRIRTMSADTGYSKFVMYRRSDLMQYSDVAHLYQNQREDGESKGEGKDEYSAAENEWISYDAFMKKYHADTELDPIQHTHYKSTNCSGATATADTRNIYQVKDVNIAFYKEVQIRNHSTTSGSSTAAGRTNNKLSQASIAAPSLPQEAHFIVQGKLSQKTDYVFTMDEEPYIGQFTPTGWIVKARNLYFPHKGDEEHYLLGFSEKFDFKSKIVTISELEMEMRNVSGSRK